jgi:hypothetical protein
MLSIPDGLNRAPGSNGRFADGPAASQADATESSTRALAASGIAGRAGCDRAGGAGGRGHISGDVGCGPAKMGREHRRVFEMLRCHTGPRTKPRARHRPRECGKKERVLRPVMVVAIGAGREIRRGGVVNAAKCGRQRER